MVLRIFRLNFIIQVMYKILQSHMLTKAWMWNGRILCFVALNIAMNLSDHLCSAEASTNGEFHLHNAKRKQYSSILHSFPHKLWDCNILNIHFEKIQSKNPSIQATSGRNQRLNFERYAPYNQSTNHKTLKIPISCRYLHRHSSHNREFHNVNCRFCGAVHNVNRACISVLSQVIHNVNERKTVQTNIIFFVSYGDGILKILESLLLSKIFA